LKVIYYGNSATHTAYAMAAIHIGNYEKGRLPCLEDILRQWELCFIYGFQKGNLIYMGLDDELREIYVIGCGTHGKMLNRIYNGFNTIYNIEESIHFIKAHIGEWVPRFLVVLSMQFPSLKPIIRHLFIIWYKKMYPLWFKIVQREKEKLIKGKKL